jgi:parallel beta-helix repeat protein
MEAGMAGVFGTTLVLALAVTLGAPSLAAANDLCGATIFVNLKLNHDLTCTGDGLIVGADGIRLDLNGHTVAGSGSGVGIRVFGRNNVSISGGTVRNFEAGIRVLNSASIVVKENQFLENGDGVDLQAGSIGITIKENEFSDNRARAVMLRTSTGHNVITENTFTGNRVGILVFGAVDTTVKENIVSSSSLAGIRINVIATRNLIVENTIVSNPAGIDFIVTATGTSTGNGVVENTIAMNSCGLKGPIAGNTFEENLFQGNGADSCP